MLQAQNVILLLLRACRECCCCSPATQICSAAAPVRRLKDCQIAAGPLSRWQGASGLLLRCLPLLLLCCLQEGPELKSVSLMARSGCIRGWSHTCICS